MKIFFSAGLQSMQLLLTGWNSVLSWRDQKETADIIHGAWLELKIHRGSEIFLFIFQSIPIVWKTDYVPKQTTACWVATWNMVSWNPLVLGRASKQVQSEAFIHLLIYFFKEIHHFLLCGRHFAFLLGFWRYKHVNNLLIWGEASIRKWSFLSKTTATHTYNQESHNFSYPCSEPLTRKRSAKETGSKSSRCSVALTGRWVWGRG